MPSPNSIYTSISFKIPIEIYNKAKAYATMKGIPLSELVRRRLNAILMLCMKGVEFLDVSYIVSLGIDILKNYKHSKHVVRTLSIEKDKLIHIKQCAQKLNISVSNLIRGIVALLAFEYGNAFSKKKVKVIRLSS